jgi:crotonobetainyl-CoA:carnitine CoA-transferase CaiB-like acyl-CoA transferase
MRIKDLLAIETGPGMAGPLVTRTLSDLGARVIKVESSTRLDFGKARLPPPGKTAEDSLESPGVMEMSGGKESVSLNLKTEVGKELFLKLIDLADVYVESYAPGWLERLGLSLQLFQKRNPRLVILSQSAYGGDGPRSDQRAYAPLMTALAGVESLVGYDDGRIVPQIASAVGDIVAAQLGNLLVLSALYERDRTGRGAVLDMSQTEASVAMTGIALAEYGISGKVPRPRGNRDPRAVPHGVYPAAGEDAWVAIAVWTDAEWDALCAELNVAGEDSGHFASAAARLAAPDEVDALVARNTAVVARDELFTRLQRAGVACTPVLDTYESDDFPALRDRGLWSAVPHPRLGELRMTEVPWKFDHVELRRRDYAEKIGASTDRVLSELLSIAPDEIDRWRQAGALT